MSQRVLWLAVLITLGLTAAAAVLVVSSRDGRSPPPWIERFDARLAELTDLVERLDDRLEDLEVKDLMASQEQDEDPAPAAPGQPDSTPEDSAPGQEEDPAARVDRRLSRMENRLQALEVQLKALAADPVRRGLELIASPTGKLREKGVSLLGKLAGHDPEARDAVFRMLADPDRDVRKEAIQALGKLKDPAAAAPLRALYDQGAGKDALLLADALKKLGDEGPFVQEMGRLSHLAVSGENEEVRRDAVRDLARYALEGSREVFLQAANDPSEQVKKEAERALKDLEKPGKAKKEKKAKPGKTGKTATPG